jgi:hypothetical protein
VTTAAADLGEGQGFAELAAAQSSALGALGELLVGVERSGGV